jgi:hypothetical protein
MRASPSSEIGAVSVVAVVPPAQTTEADTVVTGRAVPAGNVPCAIGITRPSILTRMRPFACTRAVLRSITHGTPPGFAPSIAGSVGTLGASDAEKSAFPWSAFLSPWSPLLPSCALAPTVATRASARIVSPTRKRVRVRLCRFISNLQRVRRVRPQCRRWIRTSRRGGFRVRRVKDGGSHPYETSAHQ